MYEMFCVGGGELGGGGWVGWYYPKSAKEV